MNLHLLAFIVNLICSLMYGWIAFNARPGSRERKFNSFIAAVWLMSSVFWMMSILERKFQ